MAPRWWDAVSAPWRFGGAVRLQKAGRLSEAREALVALNDWFDERKSIMSPQFFSYRLMTLIHLAEVARRLGDECLARSTLEKWLAEYERAASETPNLRSVETLSRWEKWVRETLTSTRQG